MASSTRPSAKRSYGRTLPGRRWNRRSRVTFGSAFPNSCNASLKAQNRCSFQPQIRDRSDTPPRPPASLAGQRAHLELGRALAGRIMPGRGGEGNNSWALGEGLQRPRSSAAIAGSGGPLRIKLAAAGFSRRGGRYRRILRRRGFDSPRSIISGSSGSEIGFLRPGRGRCFGMTRPYYGIIVSRSSPK